MKMFLDKDFDLFQKCGHLNHKVRIHIQTIFLLNPKGESPCKNAWIRGSSGSAFNIP